MGKFSNLEVSKFAGRTVIDAPLPFTLKITPLDCSRGVRGKHGLCVAWQALHRKFPNLEVEIWKSVVLIAIDSSGPVFRYRNSAALMKAIKDFDTGGEFPPGNYVLKPRTSAQIAHDKTPRHKPSGKHNKRKYVVVSGVRGTLRIHATVLA